MSSSEYSALAVLKTAMEIREIQDRSPAYEGMGRLIRVVGQEDSFCEVSIALCRILFEAKSGTKMRHPYCGEPRLIGDSTISDWPMYPIHLYLGVPFLVVMGWTVAGRQETGADYLAFCLYKCAWRDQAVKHAVDAKNAAESFIKSGAWRRPLTSEEESFLLRQVAPLTAS